MLLQLNPEVSNAHRSESPNPRVNRSKGDNPLCRIVDIKLKPISIRPARQLRPLEGTYPPSDAPPPVRYVPFLNVRDNHTEIVGGSVVTVLKALDPTSGAVSRAKIFALVSPRRRGKPFALDRKQRVEMGVLSTRDPNVSASGERYQIKRAPSDHRVRHLGYEAEAVQTFPLRGGGVEVGAELEGEPSFRGDRRSSRPVTPIGHLVEHEVNQGIQPLAFPMQVGSEGARRYI